MNHPENWQIDSAISFGDGKSLYLKNAAYNLHRYENEWYALWHDPSAASLGHVLKLDELRRFMNGQHTLGRVIEGSA